MANWLYYPQSSLVRNSTITNLVGTLSVPYNSLNDRQHAVTKVATLSAGECSFRIDLGSGNTLAPDFIAIVNNTIYTDTANLTLLTGSTDDGSTWDETIINAYAFLSTDEPIYLKVFAAGIARRYFKVKLTNASTASTWGGLLLGNKVSTTLTVNYGEPIDNDTSGIRMNETSGGAGIGVVNYGIRRMWNVRYEYISTADKDLLLGLQTSTTGQLRPFVFTDTAGAIYYVRLNSGIRRSEVAAGLWNVDFQLREEA